ncbi:antibiotic ABC transporter ATP-binding protein [Paenibacillus dendritiformis]|uniref:ABC transporter ATP-binding protein n=1 Tax=Paenibacillus dendritiformis TaxID=130049 RepID=UPI0018CE0B5F|nr:ABC transporter ATP-binding protein [Paenibacillus dendritiformis]MBG9795933.1 antibiotic ABC transporter ATP-binding protein [Paenibacillus dendritiformis]
MSLLTIQNLVKRYGDDVAVNGVNLQVEPGDIYGVLGPNGAGKSSTIHAVTGLLNFDQGHIVFEDGKTIDQWSSHIGLVPQELAIYLDLSAQENVEFFCSLYGFSNSEVKQRAQHALDFVGLKEVKEKRADHFSGGMKRRLNLACAISHSPKLLIMDEPTVGIDPQSRNHILESVLRLRDEGVTVIYTSHYMEEVNEICNKIAIIDHGKVIANGTKQEIKGMVNEMKMCSISFSQNIKDAKALQRSLLSIPGVTKTVIKAAQCDCFYEKDAKVIEPIVMATAAAGLEIDDIVNETPSLETVFLSLTGKQLRD